MNPVPMTQMSPMTQPQHSVDQPASDAAEGAGGRDPGGRTQAHDSGQEGLFFEPRASLGTPASVRLRWVHSRPARFLWQVCIGAVLALIFVGLGNVVSRFHSQKPPAPASAMTAQWPNGSFHQVAHPPTGSPGQLRGAIVFSNQSGHRIADGYVRVGGPDNEFCMNAPYGNSIWHVHLAPGASQSVTCILPFSRPSSLPAHTFQVDWPLTWPNSNAVFVHIDNPAPFTVATSS